MKIAVLGAGAWGTALAVALAGSNKISLWCRNEVQARAMCAERENRRYLPDIDLADAIDVVDDIECALESASLAIFAVPTAGLRDALTYAGQFTRDIGCVLACKGFEKGSGKLPHEVVAEELSVTTKCAVLSGPSFAADVAKRLPTAVTLASRDGDFSVACARQLHTGRFRVYSSTDLIGVEIGGAVKNVIAIAAGICDGMKLGHSARAALITRGLAEMTRLGLQMGGRVETFMGLSGLGDLALTCTGDLSRNRRVGLALASGDSLSTVLADLGHVAEGVHTADEVLRMAERRGVEMPITQSVAGVLNGALSPGDALEGLLQRDPKSESLG
jgi:glycerol-3-phosphate dehydrogenase (NAD(P)+)